MYLDETPEAIYERLKTTVERSVSSSEDRRALIRCLLLDRLELAQDDVQLAACARQVRAVSALVDAEEDAEIKSWTTQPAR